MSTSPCPKPLDLNLPLDGMQLIEASAGTGKTFTLAGLYVRLIVEQDLVPSRILVMTFTRAATDELRQRLRERLDLAVRVAEALAPGGTPLPEAQRSKTESVRTVSLLERHLAASGETAAALALRLRSALRRMDEAAILTIHGFCQRVLSDFAPLFDASQADATLVPSDRDLIDDYATDFWLRVADDGQSLAVEALGQLGDQPQALANKLAGLIAFDGVLEASAAPPAAPDAQVVAARDAAREALFESWQRDGAQAVAAFLQLLRKGGLHGNTFRAATTESRLAALHSALEAGLLPNADLLQRFGQAKILGALNALGRGFKVPAPFAAIDAYRDAEARVDATRASHRAALIERAHRGVLAHLAERKRALARFSYDDLIGRLAQAIEGDQGEALAAGLRARYPVALLDEFQDTDTRQFGIFQRVYAEQGTLIMVGDPKQAIYGFRGGDLHAYLRVADQLGESRRHRLDENFRSSPAMLDAVAALFGMSDTPFIDEGIEFKQVKAGGKVADGELKLHGKPLTPLTLWPQPDSIKNKDEVRTHYADACAASVAELLRHGTLRDHDSGQERPLQHQRIAVLTNDNKEILVVQDALSQLGIASACVRQESLYASREARELLRLLDALLAPQSMARARGALATQLLGGALSDLARMAADADAWRAALEGLADLRQRWFDRGILAMVARLGEHHAARLLSLSGGERVLGNLLQLGEALQADARALAGEQALRDRLAQRIGTADAKNQEEQLRLESDAERVQVLTIHRSKGLEFDVVLLPFACQMEPRQIKAGQILDFHRANERVKYWLLNGKDERTDADGAALEATAVEQKSERMRCFYVGITRAAHACFMSSGGKGDVLAHLMPEDNTGGTLAQRCAAIEVAAAPEPGERVPVASGAALHPARTFDGTIRRDWRRHSFSRLTRGEHVLGAAKRDEPESTAVETSGAVIEAPAGARFGTAVHAILEKTDFASWRDCIGAPPGGMALVERELRTQGYAISVGADSAAPATAQLVAASLNAEVMPGLRLADLAPAARRAEMEFDFGIAGCDARRLLGLLHAAGYQRHRDGFAGGEAHLRGLMNGIIDLVFVHQGRWYIVDYKTNFLGRQYRDYVPERLRQAVADNDYDLQYLIYTVALHRWLRRNLGMGWDYPRDFGGVRYLFLRGLGGDVAEAGIHIDRPPLALIEALDAALGAEGAP